MITFRTLPCLFLSGFITSASAEELYKVTGLTALEPGFYASDINNNGVIAGHILKPGNRRFAHVDDHGATVHLPAILGPGQQGGDSYAHSINTAGDIAGIAYQTGHAFIYQNGNLIDLGSLEIGGPGYTGVPNGGYSTAADLNDSGQAVGTTGFFVANTDDGIPTDGFRTNHAFLYQNGTMISLGTLDPDEGLVGFHIHESQANAINNNGQIVGMSEYDESQSTHAFLYQNGTMTDLGTMAGGSESSALDINDQGQIVGFSWIAENGQNITPHAFVYSGGIMTDLHTRPEFFNSVATSINETGLIVGNAQLILDSRSFAFIHFDGAMRPLNELAADFLADPDSEGFVSLEYAAAINDFGQITGHGTYRDANGDVDYRSFLLAVSKSSVFAVKNANRHGNPTGGVDDVAVTFIAGEQGEIVTLFTGDDGTFEIENSNIDVNALHDIRLEKNGTVRVYQAVRPSEVISGATQLVLPVSLHDKLTKELEKLQATGALVLDYDTQKAVDLLTLRRSTAQPEILAVHRDRDQALARLLIAAEGMNRTYAAVEPLALDSAKLLTDNLLAILAMNKAAAELKQQLAGQLAAGVASQAVTSRAANFALTAAATGLKHGLAAAQKLLVDGTKAVLPPWGAEIVNQASGVIIKGMLATFASGDWDKKKAVPAGREALLEGLAKSIGEEVGGRIFASAYVAETQQHFDLAELRARATHPASGTVAQAFIASQNRAIEAEQRADFALDASKTVDDTSKKFEIVADVSEVVGKIPAAQIAGVMAQFIKGLNLGLTVSAAAGDLYTFHEITFEDTPAVADLAFNPAAPTPLPRLSRSAPRLLEPRSLTPDYANALAAARTAVEANNTHAALDAGEMLLAQDPIIETEITTTLLRLRGLISASNPSSPALNQSLVSLTAAVSNFQIARAVLYPALAGYVVPQMADPDHTAAQLLSEIDAVSSAIGAINNAIAATDEAAEGLTAPAIVLTTAHGLSGTAELTATAPGPIVFKATFTNAGDLPAENFAATFTPETTGGAVPSVRMISNSTQAIGTLAAGDSVEITWSAIATDLSADATGTAASYKIITSSSNTPAGGAEGSFEIITPKASYADWIDTFNGVDDQTDFTDDPDHDGTSNGLERLFGSHPGVAGKSTFTISNHAGSPLAFSHSRSAAPGDDAAITYQWSRNLADWYPSGNSQSGVKVTMTPSVVAGEGSETKTVQVIPIIQGQADRLFFRIAAEPTAPLPAEPAPVAPQITSQPQSILINQDQAATFSVIAAGTGPFLYQWRKDGVDIPAANRSTYQIPAANSSHQGSYQVRITNPGGNLLSAPATLAFRANEI